MSHENCEIDLEDVFKNIIPYDGPKSHVSPPTPRDRSATLKHERTTSVHVTEQKNQEPAHVHVAAPAPVPVKTTVQHHVQAPAPRPINQVPQELSASSASLLNKVFGAVQLPTVQLTPATPLVAQTVEHLRSSDPTKELDDILADHDEPAYFAPSKQSSLASIHDEVEIHKSFVVPDEPEVYASEGHPQYTTSVVSKVSKTVPKVHHEEHSEDYDSFEIKHVVPRLQDGGSFRSRTNTIDSTISKAETRLGGFDFHDNLGLPANWQNQVDRSEIAQVEEANMYSRKHSIASTTVQRSKLNDLQKEVTEARNKQSVLQQKVNQENQNVERLRQKTVAYEATQKAFQFASQKEDWISRSNAHSQVGKVQEKVQAPPPKVTQVNHVVEHRHVPAAPKLTFANVNHTLSPAPEKKKIDVPHVVYPKTPTIRNTHSKIYYEEPTVISQVAYNQLVHGDKMAEIDGISLIVPQYELVQNYSRSNKINKVIIGGDAEPSDDDKTVLLFGLAQSGKTSLINSILNYVYDVKKENDFRFVLDEEVLPTTGLTAYTINHSILGYNVTIVDTPGVIANKKTKTVSTLVKQWFEDQLLRTKAFRLDAISIVLKHNESTLGWPFIYELAAIKKLFGDDVKTNVLPVITNSEVISQPLAVRSLHQANISFVDYYKVNNLGFAAEAESISKLKHNLFYTHGIASFERFFSALQEHIHPLIAVLRHKDGKSVQPAPQLRKAVLY